MSQPVHPPVRHKTERGEIFNPTSLVGVLRSTPL